MHVIVCINYTCSQQMALTISIIFLINFPHSTTNFFFFSFVGFEKMSSLRNLRILDLGYNYFDNNTIPQSLGAVTSLETLILTHNNLQGYFPAQGGFFYLISYDSIYSLISLIILSSN
jgi:hypothetical protein